MPPANFNRPQMMAIGDSLYQGVRSLTVTKDLCRSSAPAQVARALGTTDFASPDPDSPILIDLETWLGDPDIKHISAWLGLNAANWLAAPASPSGAECFDNVAVAGSEVWHLYAFNATNGQAQAASEMAKLGGEKLSLDNIGAIDLGSLFYGLNARFTLNPSNSDDYAGMSQLDWATLRKPKQLLINIGSNNGLWNMCLNALPNAQFYFGKSYGPNAGLPKDYSDYTQIYELAEALAKLPAETEVYFNSLGRPRCVGNLMPEGNTGDPNHDDYLQWYEHAGAGYFDTYENRFALSPTAYGRITGDQMKAMDDYVAGVNAKIQGILQAEVKGPKLVFVDMYKLLSDNDAKHYGDGAAFIADNKRISNNMFESGPLGGFRMGGVFGLDGMHPTTVGYGLMAQAVLAAMGNASRIDLEALCDADTLIQNAPALWTLLMYVWRDIRKAMTPAQKAQADHSDGKIALLAAATAAAAGANRR